MTFVSGTEFTLTTPVPECRRNGQNRSRTDGDSANGADGNLRRVGGDHVCLQDGSQGGGHADGSHTASANGGPGSEAAATGRGGGGIQDGATGGGRCGELGADCAATGAGASGGVGTEVGGNAVRGFQDRASGGYGTDCAVEAEAGSGGAGLRLGVRAGSAGGNA